MDGQTTMATVAIAISLLALVFSRLDARRSASNRHVDSMETRLSRVEKELEACLRLKDQISAQHAALVVENVELMKQIVRRVKPVKP